jgi:hypothetical protein
MATLTAFPSSHGPESSMPGIPAMLWRMARTLPPAMDSQPLWKNLISGSGPRWSFSRSAGALGPSTW